MKDKKEDKYDSWIALEQLLKLAIVEHHAYKRPLCNIVYRIDANDNS